MGISYDGGYIIIIYIKKTYRFGLGKLHWFFGENLFWNETIEK